MTQLYIPMSDGFEARAAWKRAAARLGVEVVAAPVTPHVLPLSNMSSVAVASMTGVNYMDAATVAILSDNTARAAHFPALLAIAAKTQADLVPLGDGPVFLKPRANLKKGNAPLAYRRWPSVSAFLAEAWTEFAAYQANPWPHEGELVVCPDLGSSMSIRGVDIAVNAQSQVYVMHTHTCYFAEHNRPGLLITDGAPLTGVEGAIQDFCTARGIKGGIHSLQFVQHDGSWKIMDWNTRPIAMYTTTGCLHPGVADAGLAHMLGLECQAVPVHMETRSYWDRVLPANADSLARQVGLGPDWNWNRARLSRINGVGDTPAAVQAKFDAFEASIA